MQILFLNIKFIPKKPAGQQGVSIFLAVVILTLLMSVSLGISTLLVSQIRTMRDLGNSVAAFYASESGIEEALKLASNETYNSVTVTLSNGATYQAAGVASGVGSCGAFAHYCVKSIGMYKGTRRVIEIQL
jgi:hypothetical protein